VRGYGGEVAILPYTAERSTSALIERMRSAECGARNK
jgi:bifunctional ADP-heptose synthase (sugar kinase/adenylyltransferase)